MPYYIKQKITNQIINVLMIILLILTLFPIGWMVYCSLKNNTEILLGKIPIGRAATDVILIQPENSYLWTLTSDGGINKYSKSTNKLIKHISLKTAATNYAMDDDYIWVSSGGQGLIRTDKKTLKEIKYFKTPLTGLDQNKIVSSSIIKDSNFVWLSLRYRGFEKILRFDTRSLQFLEPISLSCNLSPFQILTIADQNNFIWVGTSVGLIKFDKTSRQIAVSSASTDLGIDSLPIYNLTVMGPSIFAGTDTGLYEFRTADLNLAHRYLKSEKITSTLITAEQIYAGTNTGISIINRQNGRSAAFEKLFKSRSQTKELEPDTVFSINQDGNFLLLGSTDGKISVFNLPKHQTVEALKSKEGHLKIMFSNYIDLWKNINFGLYLKNSFLICGMTMILAMIISTFSAYALARFNFPGSKLFSMSILATQMIPAIMLLIPIYIMFIKFTDLTGLPVKGTFAGLIMIYSAFFIPFSIWILRGFFAAIPRELEEAARIDGCSPFQVFWYISLRLAVPGIIATGIYVFLTAWDELMFAWVLTNANTITVPVGIRYFVGNYQNRFDLMMAAATVATIPVIILFFLLQRHIVKGLTAGAVKG